MKGLLLKDWYMLCRYGKWNMIFGVVYIFLGAFSSIPIVFAIIGVMLGAMQAQLVMAYEEKEKWDQMAAYLPVTAGQIVLSKYLVAAGSVLVTSLITAVAMLAGTHIHIHEESSVLPPLMALGLVLPMGLLLTAAELPILFKFGVSKGRIYFIILLVLISACTGGGSQLLAEIQKSEMLPWTAQLASFSQLILLVLAVAAVVGSYWLSVRFYKKREF